MSKRTDDNIRLNFIINGDPARQQINEIDKEAAKLRTQMKGLKKDSKEYTDSKKQLAALTEEKKKLTRQIGLAGMTMRELNTEARRLRAIQANLVPGTQKFKEVNKELTAVNARIAQLRNGSRQTGLSLNGMADSFNKYIGVVAGVTASLAGVVLGSRRAVEEFNEFEQAMASLSSLTGLVGEDLAWLGQEADLMSTSVVEGGVRIRQSAQDIVNAYMIVGSQRPELLQNREALAEVTQEAMILAEAANMKLHPAVKALTNTMNQFQLPASEARNVINAIAAGSKAGAADIPYLSEAIEKAGTTARLMGLSVEQMVGAVETVAPFYSRAEMAGNSLDKVMLRMRANNIGFVNGVFDMQTALNELQQRFNSGETAVDIFGVEHAKMAEILVANRGEFERYTEAVTGSNVAIEQASINTDTNAAKLEQARNRYRQNLRELGGMLSGIMTFSTNAFSYLMKAVIEIAKNWDKYREVVLALIATYVAYNTQAIIAAASVARVNIAIAAQNVLMKTGVVLSRTATAATQLFAAAKFKLAGNTAAATNAMKLFRAATLGTPWGVILGLITAVSAAIVLYKRHKEEATEAELAHARVQEEINKQYDKQAAEITRISSVIEDSTIPLEKRREAIARMSELMPDYNAYLDDEGKLHQHNAEQIEEYLEQLKNKIALNVLDAELNDLIERRMALQRELEQSDKDLAKAQNDRVNATIRDSRELTGYTNAVNDARRANQNIKDDLGEVETAISGLDEEYKKIIKTMDDLFTSVTDNDDALDNNNDTVEEAAGLQDILKQRISETEKAFNQLTIAARNAAMQALDTGDFTGLEEMQKQLAALKTELDNLKADDIILDGIVNAGSTEGFLDTLTDSEEAELEERTEMNRQFLENWAVEEKEAVTNYLLWEFDERQRLYQEDEEAKRKSQKKKEELEKASMEKMKNFILSSTTAITYGISDIYGNLQQKKTDDALAALNQERENALSNESLTEQQKEQINEQFRKKEAQIKRQAFIREKRAKIIESLINTAVAITEALPDPLRVAYASIAGAMQTGVIISQPVPQYAKGKYKVKGKDDGKTYQANWIDKPRTGLYTRPALFAETGGEIFIDPRTTQNILTNYPEIMDAIQAARVPQYAQGNIPPRTDNTQQRQADSAEDAQQMKEYVMLFGSFVMTLVDKGIDVRIAMTEFDKKWNKFNDTKGSASRD